MKNPYISGVQQIGIGVVDVSNAWKWYRKAFGMNVSVFDDKAEAALMTKYTFGKVESRRAALAMNMNGGGGFEIWQYTSKVPVAPNFKITLGDLGIYAAKMKSFDIKLHHEILVTQGLNPSKLIKKADGTHSFWISDIYGNPFEVVEEQSWFKTKNSVNGGVCGASIGVSNMDESIAFYKEVMGLYEMKYDLTGKFDDLAGFEDRTFRRVLLYKPMENSGAFGRLLGGIQIELFQWLDGDGKKMFENRAWGDQGYIHLCFDTIDMKGLKTKVETSGHAFTVDSGETFDMGDSGGRFAYVEDPDGALIELVETHKVPVMKKIGWYFNLKDRKDPLPNWMVGLLGLNKVKD